MDDRSDLPQALLLGDLDVAYPLRAAGIPVTVLRDRDDPTRFSRVGIRWVERPDEPAALLHCIREIAAASGHRPVLFVQDDHDLRLVSDHRDELHDVVALRMPDAATIAALTDKGLFQRLAELSRLPVPRARIVSTDGSPDAFDRFRFPVLLKPLVRDPDRDHDDFGDGKALLAADRPELDALLRRVGRCYRDVLAQEYVAGPESSVESYHVYVGGDGRILGEFTGRKIRTTPASFGYSTALVTTDAPDVIELGRRVVAAFDLVGVAKIDVKRAPDGSLWLLEVNPRFSLWQRLGAAAGCDLATVAYADLTGRRPPPVAARAGVTWSRQPRDLLVAHASGEPLLHYVRWLRTCDAVAGLRPSDPMPFVRGSLWTSLRGRWRTGTPVAAK